VGGFCGQATNGADPLRYAFIVSQAELVGSREEAEVADYHATTDLEGIGEVTVGVTRAQGSKCSRYGSHRLFPSASPCLD
jgi:isoleucyl-tRNA synthetase